MPGFFEARDSFKPQEKPSNFYIVVENTNILSLTREAGTNTVQIDRDTYKFLLDNDIAYYIYNNGIEKRPKKTSERIFTVLRPADSGYALFNCDPYWPTEITEGGYTWQTPSE